MYQRLVQPAIPIPQTEGGLGVLHLQHGHKHVQDIEGRVPAQSRQKSNARMSGLQLERNEGPAIYVQTYADEVERHTCEW